MNVEGHFTVRRYWLQSNTPWAVLNTLNNVRSGVVNNQIRPYVDISYYGEGDRNITIMELKYGEWIHTREQIFYTVKGDDGL